MQRQYRYFPRSTAQETWGLFVSCAGRSRAEPGAEFPSRAHPDEYYFSWERGRVLHEWQFILIKEGRGELEFRHRHIALKPGMLLALPPRQWHRYRPDSATGWSTLFIGFGGDTAAKIMRGAGFSLEGDVRDLSTCAAARESFAATVAGLLDQGETRPFSAAAQLYALVATLTEEIPDGTSGMSARRQDIVHRAQAHLAEHCAEIVDCEALANALGVPYRTFRHLFTHACGVPPHRYQLLVRLKRAKRLLEYSNMPIAEISSALGFRSAWHFAHFFQRETGCSAMQYRQNRRAKSYQPMESGPE